jgi:hypothetical protein
MIHIQYYYRVNFHLVVPIIDITKGNEGKQAEILNKANIPYILLREDLLSSYQYSLIE